MKQLIQATLSIGLVLSSLSSVEACCLWPFCGWGAGYAPAYGYAPAPSYGYYAAGYPSFDAPAYGGYYSAGYAQGADCCVPSCCSSCGSGSCSSGSCAGSIPSGSGSLKPANDPNFKNGTQKDEYDGKDSGRDSPDSPPDDLPPFDRPGRTRTNETNPNDDFDSTPIGGTNPDDEMPPFGADPDGESQIKNKPPMPDATDLPAVDPNDGTTFLNGESRAMDKHTQIVRRQNSLTERSSGLNEVIIPRRLASRSLPAAGVRNPASWAGKSNDDKAQTGTPVRWISVPKPEDQVRL